MRGEYIRNIQVICTEPASGATNRPILLLKCTNKIITTKSGTFRQKAGNRYQNARPALPDNSNINTYMRNGDHKPLPWDL